MRNSGGLSKEPLSPSETAEIVVRRASQGDSVPLLGPYCEMGFAQRH